MNGRRLSTARIRFFTLGGSTLSSTVRPIELALIPRVFPSVEMIDEREPSDRDGASDNPGISLAECFASVLHECPGTFPHTDELDNRLYGSGRKQILVGLHSPAWAGKRPAPGGGRPQLGRRLGVVSALRMHR
jgi:hypothetical protein